MGKSRTTRRPPARHRRIAVLLGVAAVAGLTAAAVLPRVDDAVREITLPLRHEDIIRQQSRQKDVDAALIAAVIYAESHFRDQTSPAGAKGLMQVTPATAKFIAQRTGGTAFEVDDLSTPQVNISYGTYYLRYLIDRYGGNEVLAVAAYNGGEGNVDRWIGEAGAQDRSLRIRDIPFPETREYVKKVIDARGAYRRTYARQLGLTRSSG